MGYIARRPYVFDVVACTHIVRLVVYIVYSVSCYQKIRTLTGEACCIVQDEIYTQCPKKLAIPSVDALRSWMKNVGQDGIEYSPLQRTPFGDGWLHILSLTMICCLLAASGA